MKRIPRIAKGRPKGRAAFWVLAAASALAALMCFVYQPPTARRPRTPAIQAVQQLPAERRELPAAPPDSYVGSTACRECHREIADLYTSHPMAQSLHAIGQAPVVENYDAGPFRSDDLREYEVTRQDGAVFHHERLRDASGEVIYDQAMQVGYALGSGQRGRAYLIPLGDQLYQSSIGWYSNGDQWDLSPGYNPQFHPRFERRIGDGCLYCHAGRVDTKAAGSNQYQSPAFVEASIGCERCHGPGADHIAFHQSNPPTDALDPIVNPADLALAERDDVCNQCHLSGKSVVPRFGRNFYDFRPGDRLHDALVVFIGKEDLDANGFVKAVSHVEQMRASQCYLQTEGAMSCTSCHDPHQATTPSTKDAFFRQRCFSCHEDDSCGVPRAVRMEGESKNSCIVCHMPPLRARSVPHTAQTDHRILARPETAEPLTAESQNLRSMRVFADGEEQLADWEVHRARGIAMMTVARNRPDRSLVAQAIGLLVPESMTVYEVARVIAQVGEDSPTMQELGLGCYYLGEFTLAEQYWLATLEIDSANETALNGLASLAEQNRDLVAYGRYLARLEEVNPFAADVFTRLAKWHLQAGRQRESAAQAERALELNPTLVDLREWLAQLYRSLGDQESADRHASVVSRMRTANSNR